MRTVASLRSVRVLVNEKSPLVNVLTFFLPSLLLLSGTTAVKSILSPFRVEVPVHPTVAKTVQTASNTVKGYCYATFFSSMS